ALSPHLAEMSVAEAMAEAVKRFHEIAGSAPEAVSFGHKLLDADALDAARRLGVRAVVADRLAQRGLPAWMRWRTAPFAAHDDLAVLPVSMILSTPAHDRDRVVTHSLRTEDPLTAGMAEPIVRALARTVAGRRLI